MSKYRLEECCYELMPHGVGGQSQPSKTYQEFGCNDYEDAKWNSSGYEQSGMKGK